jgi:hypothetical protein
MPTKASAKERSRENQPMSESASKSLWLGGSALICRSLRGRVVERAEAIYDSLKAIREI